MEKLIAAALIITLVMITMRVGSSLVFIKVLGIRNSVLMGLSHSMPLTLLIAVATLAYHAHSIDKLHYYAFILAALFEVIIAMVSIKIIYKDTDDVNSVNKSNKKRFFLSRKR